MVATFGVAVGGVPAHGIGTAGVPPPPPWPTTGAHAWRKGREVCRECVWPNRRGSGRWSRRRWRAPVRPSMLLCYIGCVRVGAAR